MSSSTTSDTTSIFASRPDTGTKGRMIALFANHFPLKFDANLMIYHYDVDMEPIRLPHFGGDELQAFAQMSMDSSEKKKYKKLNNKIYRIVVEEAVKQYSRSDALFNGILPVYDGQKNLYTTKMLNLDKYTPQSSGTQTDDNRAVGRIVVDINEDGRDMKYALNLKFASVIDMNTLRMYFDGRSETVPSDALQVLNIVLRHGPTLYKVPIGNSLYSTYSESIGERKDIGGGVQLAYGYFQSVRPGISGVNLVIDRTATAMYDCGFLPKFIAKLLNIRREDFIALREFRDADRNRIKKELNGIMIQVKHLTYKRKYKVVGITQLSAERQTFTQIKTDPRGVESNLGQTTVVEFFRDHYNKSLQFPHLPCVVVGSIKKPNYIPLEMCELVADQHVRKNLTNDQMVEMIRESASQLPAKRLAFIQQSAKQTIKDSKTYMDEFGISFAAGNTPLKLDGRVLAAPVLTYGMNRTVKPFDGKWDMKSDKFYRGAQMAKWVIIGFSDAAEYKFDQLERELMSWGNRMGMRVEAALKKVKVKGYDESTIAKIFGRAKGLSDELQIIVFIINPRYQYLYESIKKFGDVDNSIVTQCIKETSLNKLNPPLVQNILLKINTKLGGINTVFNEVECLQKRTMIVGVDSSHPGVADRVSKSVSACVASLDDSYVKYYATTRLQKRIQDLSSELHEMMEELLKQYVEHNKGFLPEQIVIYRDGVSEGQFNSALQKEIREMSKTFRKAREGYEPKLTYIVVQKRHHTRFFPMNASEGVGRAKNVPPGLVVDTDVVSKTHFDYFLCSHEGIQGTSRPTHYYVLWDDNGFTSDELQQITYNLTHIYVRCTRSISYPAPVAYAHLAAYRAQRHIIGLKQSDESDTGSMASANPYEPRRHRNANEELEAKIKLTPAFGSKMYFC